MKRFGLILAGGRSLRLFPEQRAKPLLRVGRQSFLEGCLNRLAGFETRVIANSKIAAEFRKSLKIKRLSFVLEPEPRDTAAAVGFALRKIPNNEKSWIAIVSADQWIPDTKLFRQFLKRVEAEIKRHPQSLFVAGSPAQSKPQDSYSQFGWMVPARKMRGEGSFEVAQFVEKPDSSQILKLLGSAALINAGMFFGTAAAFHAAYSAHFPEAIDDKFPFRDIPKLPIDRAIFEKAHKVRALKAPFEWRDLGTWEDWYALNPNPSGNFVSLERLKNVCAFGLPPLVVVERAGQLLIIPRSEARNLKHHLQASFKERR